MACVKPLMEMHVDLGKTYNSYNEFIAVKKTNDDLFASFTLDRFTLKPPRHTISTGAYSSQTRRIIMEVKCVGFRLKRIERLLLTTLRKNLNDLS